MPPTRSHEEAVAVDERAALARAVASAALRSSPRLTAFLRFIVEWSLAGDGARLKGYTIAVGALGRGADFDPRTDPIVRVEAGRLRRRLERYYVTEGADEAVVIELQRGSYAPKFLLRRNAQAAAGPEIVPEESEALDSILQRLVGLCRGQLAAMAMVVANAEGTLAEWRRLALLA